MQLYIKVVPGNESNDTRRDRSLKRQHDSRGKGGNMFGIGLRKHIGLAVLAGGLAVPSICSAIEIVAAHWGSDIASMPLAVARQLGYFKKHGVDITGVLTSEGGGTTMRNLLAGDLPYGEVGPPAVLAAVREGIDVVIVDANSVQLADNLWVTLPNSPIKSIKDLDGKKVAVTSAKSVSKALLEMSLEAAGVPVDHVQIVAAGAIPAGLTALESGGVSAAFINEPLWSARHDRYRPVFRPSEYIKHFTQNVGVTTAHYAKAHPEVIRGIVAARREAVDYIYANPKEAAKLIVKEFGDGMSLDVTTRAIEHAVELKFWSRGEIDLAGLEEVARVMIRQGELKSAVDWKQMIDQSFLPADLPRIKFAN
jgi:NitT/TauT family transport system substrate-binding protein